MSGIYDKQTLAGEANGMKKGLTVKSERSWMKTDKASSLEKLINKPLQLDINKFTLLTTPRWFRGCILAGMFVTGLSMPHINHKGPNSDKGIHHRSAQGFVGDTMMGPRLQKGQIHPREYERSISAAAAAAAASA